MNETVEATEGIRSSGDYFSLRRFSHTYRPRSRDPILALTDVSIERIRWGDIVCVLGPNGAGKSTLVRRIGGILRSGPGDGIIHLADGSEIVPGMDRLINYLYVPQTPQDGLIPPLTVCGNLVFRRLARGRVGVRRALTRSLRDDLAKFLKECGFEWLQARLDESIEGLSGGQQQIVNVLSVLFAKPDLVLLDEPTSRLDEEHRLLIWKLVESAAKDHGSAVICATHDYRMSRRIADYIVHLEDGRIKESERLRSVQSRRFVGDVRKFRTREEATKWSGVQQGWWRPEPGRLFTTGYYEGDDSIEGYLAGEVLSREDRTRREVNGSISLLGIQPNQRLVDIPCGWCRHTREFLRLGYNVIGIDINATFLRMSRTLQEEEMPSNVPRAICADMRNIPLSTGSTFSIVNLWTSFGFFDEQYDDLSVLKEWHRILKSGGKALIHSDHNPRRVKRGIFDEPPVRTLWDGGTLHVFEFYCEEDSRVYGKWWVEGRKRLGPHGYSIRVYDEVEWRSMADRVGFKVQGFYGSLEYGFKELDERDQELVVVLEKR